MYVTPSIFAYTVGKVYLTIAVYALIEQFIRHIKSARYDKRMSNEKDTS
jgi:hypothetical protein